jgi:hypothetical protein
MGRSTVIQSQPSFVANNELMDLDGGHQIDWANVPEWRRTTPGQTVVVGAAGAALNAVSVPVVALAAPIKAGTTLNFGTNKFATVTVAAALGATALTTLAIPTALVSGDAAIVAGSGNKHLPAGTVVGSKLGNGLVSPRVLTTNPAIGILVSDAQENDLAAASSGYGVYRGGAVYENLLPDATGSPAVLATAVKTELQTAGVSMGWRFEQYTDDR